MIRLMFNRLFLCLLLAFSISMNAGIAQAQENVDVRIGTHDDYSRLVFEWQKPPTYQVNREGGTLNISFGKAANFDRSSLVAQDPNIGGVSIVAGDNVSVQIPPEAKYRHFKIGKRIIFDVYNSAGQPNRMVNDNVVSRVPPERLSGAVSSNARKEMPAFPTDDVEKKPLISREPHVIKISSTKVLGLSAFARAGYLWIVVDDPELTVEPQMAGPDKDQFPPFEKFEIPSGTAFRMRQPEGFYYYGEGGGTGWRLVITPNARNVKAIRSETKRDASTSQKSVSWPLQNTGRIIALQDPAVGDVIQTILVTDHKQFIGSPRNLVEFETLNSFIGMALVPKADNLEVVTTNDSVEVFKPGGLSVSPARDTDPVALRADVNDQMQVADEPKAEEDEGNQKKFSRIYNFNRWEMSGIKALEKNRRVLMMGLGDKEGSAKVEDLFTLAKLNLANGRGNETLGVLRIAQSELPGIEENPEFLALRGAAYALAAKPDEAIVDLSIPVLEKYEEIGFWRAFALAGLEDWAQANKVMPANFAMAAEYPKHIREPMLLRLAEISLRNARVNDAEELLSSIDVAEGDVSLAKESAWKYLMGELHRQRGEDDDAFELWTELVNGKDDYYRAKAGLSLTKLQLERQKITPAKAIDRLEGLRYVWRGDELETLINFRLGEVYINNKDYVKGLAVLRNAITISPDSPMAKQVTDYMTATFRGLFSEDRINEVSPLDSLSVYEEFKELTPAGEEGDLFVLKLAERLADADLLGRASDLLQHQLDHRLQGKDALTGAIRLSAIRLLDNKPEMALEALTLADNALAQARREGGSYSAEARQITLLRARTLSKLKQTSDALALLSGLGNGEDVLRLKADIAWDGRRWSAAADAFDRLIKQEGVTTTRPATDYQSELILNRAIALNLAGNRVELEKWRKKYADTMMQTDKQQLFDLVTRPRQLGMMDKKDGIASLVAEVDMFGDFLNSYKKIN